MPEKPQDLYGSFGSVPTSLPSGGNATPGFSVRANPDDFGANIGAAVEGLGNTASKVGSAQVDLATSMAKMATEAKVNDTYANQYAPAAADLRNQYDQLRGQDKIHGYNDYITGLQNLNKTFTGNSSSPYEQHLIGSLINRHVAGEIDGAKRELVQSQLQFSDRASAEKIEAESGYAAQNYSNPQIVDQVQKTNDATVALQHINQGFDPSDPGHQAVIEEAQKNATGKMAVGMIQSAVSRGDAVEANKIRAQYASAIPGYQQLAIDKTLHTENMRQTGANGAVALQNGQPIPHAVGAPPAQVQAVVADAAQNTGIDPNHALTVARIESNMGQNLGARGDIGQTGKGGDLPTQAANMTQELKKSEVVASNALGRPAEPWEQYVAYQQGAGGGPALLKAAAENSSARAVDILSPLYKNPKKAVSAIVSNGGNTTMTAGDYLKFIHQKYEDNASVAQCDVPEGTDLVKAITTPHEQSGEVVQPAATPRGKLDNFDAKFPAMMDRAMAIPNVEVRNSIIKNIKQDREDLATASSAYSSMLVGKAQQLAIKPDFTSMDQVPSDMASALLSEHPETMRYLENMAAHNLEKASGVANKDAKEYGAGMFGLMRDVSTNKINSVTQLMAHLPGADGKGGDLTIAGFEKLKGLIVKDPETQADATMKTQAFKVIKRQLSGEDEGLGIKDPKGEELFSRALPKLFKAIEDGEGKGLTMGELTDPGSPNWIGNSVQSLKRSAVQQNMDMMNALGEKPATGTTGSTKARTFSQIYQEFKNTNDPAKKAALKKEAVDLGLIRNEKAPKAPISQ